MAEPMTDAHGTRLADDGEGTAYPVWYILDPRQMMRPDVHTLNSMVTGPFFSRASAQAHLDARRYAFSGRARVFCASGYWSRDYRRLCETGEVTDG